MNRLQAVKNGRSMANVVAKSTASRGKLNLLMANTSTPKNNRAFFVCSIRTPQENRLAVFLSMVGYSGRYFTDCLPLTTAFHTAVPYRQTVESLAVDSKNQLMESIKMNPYTLKAYIGNQSYTLNLKAQLEVMADHFESTSSLFDGNTYAHFTYSLLAAVERLEEATTAMKGGVK